MWPLVSSAVTSARSWLVVGAAFDVASTYSECCESQNEFGSGRRLRACLRELLWNNPWYFAVAVRACSRILNLTHPRFIDVFRESIGRRARIYRGNYRQPSQPPSLRNKIAYNNESRYDRQLLFVTFTTTVSIKYSLDYFYWKIQ